LRQIVAAVNQHVVGCKRHAYILAMISINSCAKCGGVVCACGFAATLFVSVFGGGQQPPPRAVGPIAAQLTAASGVSTSLTSGSWSAFLTVHDQINGKAYSAVWSDKQQQREVGSPPASMVGSITLA
jgi:hypothetical protein